MRDRNYRFFLGGIALGAMAFLAMSFVPLFLKEQVGMAEGMIVYAGAGTALGAGLSGYLWGWSSDRFGSKPVMLWALLLGSFIPICWFAVPRHSTWSVPAVVGVSMLTGLAITGWSIGFDRYLHVSAVPPEKKTPYMAVFYAWIGLIGGLGPILAGWLVDACGGVSGKVWGFSVDEYTPLFGMIALLPILGILLMRRVHAEGEMPMGEFAGLFLRGRPITAVGAVVRHRLARDESERIWSTQRIGEAKSPLNTVELIESLSDPSFNVRYEAIISAAHGHGNAKLTQPLVRILGSGEAELSVAAAWALGRLGDRSAVPALREGLHSGYALLQARSARALAALGDTESIAVFRERFQNEQNDGVRIAYAASLGSLRVEDAVGELLDFLRRTPHPSARAEVALALAKIIGSERRYMRLWQSTRSDFSTTAARTMGVINKQIAQHPWPNRWLTVLATDCEADFAKGDSRAAAVMLSGIAKPIFESGKLHLVIIREVMNWHGGVGTTSRSFGPAGGPPGPSGGG